MFKFEKEQKILDIGGVKIGGQPGQLPTVMMGSIFYHGDKIVEDEKEGIFDKKKAEEILRAEEEISLRTGMKRIIDVVGPFAKSFVKYIDFICEQTKSPFLIDGTTVDVRVPAVKHVGEVGLADRAVYNSIMPGVKPEDREKEVTAIKDAGVKAAILLTFNPKMSTIKGRLEVLKELLDIAKEAGIEKTIVDTTILDVPDPGPVSKTIYLVKENYGLPAGSGAHNAIDRWHERHKLEPTRYLMSTAVAFASTIMMGADFLLYGPLKRAPETYTTCALADAYVAYSMQQEYGIRPLEREHPLYKIFTV